MRPTTLRSTRTCLGILLACACGQVAPDGATTLAGDDSEPRTREQTLTLPPVEPAELGRAYDSQSQTLLFRSCLTGAPSLGPVAEGELQAAHNLSFDQVLDKVTGSIDVGFQLAVVKAGAGASIANQHASSALAETFHMAWVAKTKSDVLMPETIRVNDNGQRAIDTQQPRLQKLCGDEFIAEMQRGASFLATLKLEFLNNEDRRELQGKLRVNVPAGAVEVDGSLSSVNEAKLRRTSLSVLVQQGGGHPERMLGILPDGLMTCSLENRDPCLKTFENLIKYAREDFSQQIRERDLQNVLGYRTKRYEDSQADALVPRAGYTLVNLAVTNKLREVERKLRAAMADELRADNLLASAGFELPAQQRQRLREIAGMAGDNVLTYADISRYCYSDMDEDCLTYARSRQGNPLATAEAERQGDVFEYDPRELDIELPATASPGTGKCPASAEGQPCDDGSFCSEESVCRSGVCTATRAKACAALNACDEASDACICAACSGADGSCTAQRIWYRDADGDGFGDPTSGTVACTAPQGFSAGPATDCCDRDRNSYPGQTLSFSKPNACGSWDYDCSSTTSYSLACAGATACGCISRGNCNVSQCGTTQAVTIQTGIPDATYGCSRSDVGSCRIHTEQQVLQCR